MKFQVIAVFEVVEDRRITGPQRKEKVIQPISSYPQKSFNSISQVISITSNYITIKSKPKTGKFPHDIISYIDIFHPIPSPTQETIYLLIHYLCTSIFALARMVSNTTSYPILSYTQEFTPFSKEIDTN